MNSRLLDVVPYMRRRHTLAAPVFNQLRLAVLRLPTPVRLPLTGLRNLELVMERDAWICVDPLLDDYPVAAWSEFQLQGRDALHHPVNCRVGYYHPHAAMIARQVLEKACYCARARLRPASWPR